MRGLCCKFNNLSRIGENAPMAYTAIEHGTLAGRCANSVEAFSTTRGIASQRLPRRYPAGTFVFMIAVLLCFMAFCPSATADQGPLKTTNRFPLHMLVLTPQPMKAGLPGQGELEATLALEYSNTYFNFRNQRWDLVIDMELMVAELSMVYGLTDKWALRLDLPLVSQQDGFLDGFLENYHDFLGVSNYGREDRPKNEFAYRVSKDDRVWIDGEADNFQIGESRLSAQYALPSYHLGDRPVTGAILTTLKLPTGNSDLGLGSGAYDAGVFLPMSLEGKAWSFYLMPGYIWISDPDTMGARVSARNSASLFAGAAYRYNARWRLLAQANYYSSPFEETGLSELDDGTLELSFGFQRVVSKALYWEFAFSEDLTRASPDFNIRIGVTWRFGNKNRPLAKQ